MAATMTEPDPAGGISQSIQTWGVLNGRRINVIGTIIFPHPPTPPHTNVNLMVTGSQWFTINGIPVCRMGDFASCGHPALASQHWFQIS